jgi:peptidoglycan/xylan/chitin deacetylase (PgdA/CDA1 family)
LYVSAAHLENRMALLRRSGCTVLPLGEALERLQRHDLPDRSVALTFDDGYYDFMARAWPVLSAHGYPATVYLTTGRVDHNTPIVHLLIGYALWKARDRVLDGSGLPGLDGTYPLHTPEQRQHVVSAIAALLRTIDISRKDPIARTLVERIGLDYDTLTSSRLLTLMGPAEVARMAAEGVDFQLHTHLHRTPDDPEAFVRDVVHNRERLQELTGRRATHLCYPSGVYKTSYLPPLAREGIVSATTCDPGLASRDSDPLLLPRFVDTTTVSDLEFEAWVTGLAFCLPRRTTRAHAAVN